MRVVQTATELSESDDGIVESDQGQHSKQWRQLLVLQQGLLTGDLEDRHLFWSSHDLGNNQIETIRIQNGFAQIDGVRMRLVGICLAEAWHLAS